MNIKFGENHIENIAVKVNGIKEKDTQQVESQSMQSQSMQSQSMQSQIDEQEKKMSREGVVLEISKTGIQASTLGKVDEKISSKEEIEAKKVIEVNQKITANSKKILENINI